MIHTSCENTENQYLDNCSQIKKGIINMDASILSSEFSKISSDLIPKPSDIDELGHVENFDTLIARLNTCNNISATLRCYACIKTGPPQSEIIVETDSSGTQIQRTIDILTSQDQALSFLAIHH
jgi:hypothetical protein